MTDDFHGFITTLKDKLNIVEVAGGYISLEKKGGTYWACCPFHHEKTPSFAINEADQFYHCFGCGESGDVIKFVREMENIDFMDAVKLLAERVKLPLPQTDSDNRRTAEQKRKKDVMLAILNDAAHFYLDNLNSGNADEHINYILKRQIPSNIVRTFGLGASLNFTDLPAYLIKKGYKRQDLLDSGVINAADNRLFDAQGGRLIFPIINAMGEVVAFGGRVLKKTDSNKYKNTKETMLFNKSKTLYNINLLKKLKKTQTIKEVIVVEGYMDTLSLYQAGFKNVVASMGTSLTQDQARLLKRYTDTVLISYDGDAAGKHGNIRGMEILKNEGLNVKVVPLPEGLDPDDVIKQLGPEGYAKCLSEALPLIDFKLETLKSQFDIENREEKRRFIAESVKVIRSSASAAEQEDLLKSLSSYTGITYESLKRDLNSSPAEERPPAPEEPSRKRDEASVEIKASRFVIASYIFGAKYTEDVPLDNIPFADPVHELAAKYVRSKKMFAEKVQPAELLELFGEGEEYEELCRILDFSDGDKLKGEVAEKYFNDCVKRLKTSDLDKSIARYKAAIGQTADAAERTKLVYAMQQLIATKRKINSGE